MPVPRGARRVGWARPSPGSSFALRSSRSRSRPVHPAGPEAGRPTQAKRGFRRPSHPRTWRRRNGRTSSRLCRARSEVGPAVGAAGASTGEDRSDSARLGTPSHPRRVSSASSRLPGPGCHRHRPPRRRAGHRRRSERSPARLREIHSRSSLARSGWSTRLRRSGFHHRRPSPRCRR